LAVASRFYGNLIALMQKDVKRLLGFSGIAHAGYALIGFVALDQGGYTAALYYIVSYLFMVLACFIVVCKVSPDGTNVAMEDLAGLHRRSPLLAATLIIGVFALAGIPPFAGFIGKFSLLKAALAKGHLALVILAVVNSAIAVYYYLCVVREACFRDPLKTEAIPVNLTTRLVCTLLIAGILVLGVAPSWLLGNLSSSIASMNTPLPQTPRLAIDTSSGN
jgi:NADH-quinone oxidoreductase subunit N